MMVMHQVLKDDWTPLVAPPTVLGRQEAGKHVSRVGRKTGNRRLAEPHLSTFATSDLRASLIAQSVKNPPANAGDIRDPSSISGSGSSPGGGNSNPFWYSCLENPMDRGAWWATVHGVVKSDTT